MFDTNFVVPQLPANYSIVKRDNDEYALFLAKEELAVFYHYGEAVDAAVHHFEYLQWRKANAAALFN
jgi:hypothetical protein